MTKTLEKMEAGLELIPADITWYIGDLGKMVGRQQLSYAQSPEKLDALKEHALVESAVSSNRIEGIEVDGRRVGTLVFGNARAANRDEEELRGYRRALNWIHEDAGKIPVDEATIKKLHRLTRGEIWDAGAYKTRDGDIIERYPNGETRVRFKTVSAAKYRFPEVRPQIAQDRASRARRDDDVLAAPNARRNNAAIGVRNKRDGTELPGSGTQTPEQMARLCRLWKMLNEERWGIALIGVAAFNLDFLCIHPFRDGNGRISRLLLLLQLYQQGFEVGRFISLERLIEENKDRYYETLAASSVGWHDGRHDPWPYIRYLMFIIKDAYREFEGRLSAMNSPRGSKTAAVHAAIEAETGSFSVSRLRTKCPGVSADTIRRVLKDLQAQGAVACEGRGPAATWRKTS